MFKKITIFLILSCSLCVFGCKATNTQVKPTEIQWGKAGEEPSKVWTDYSWVIVSTDKYNKE